MNNAMIWAALAGGACGMIIGFLLAYTRSLRLKGELDKQKAVYESHLSHLNEGQQQLKESLAHLSQEALKDNRAAFMQMAEQNLKQHQLVARAEMDKREKSIEGLITPIKDALGKTEQRIQQMEQERHSAYGSLTQQLKQLAETQHLLQSETRNLVTALRRPEIRGQWGEMTLKRLAELAGMVQYCDFTEQTSVQSENGIQRPDMIVRMPDQRELIIDAKTPLDAYLSATQSENDNERKAALEQHARIVRQRVKELAHKKYWEQFDKAPDYVVLFIPGDQFLSAALDIDKKLMEYALSNQVILATPTSLIALLRAVAFGWRQQAVADNAAQIQQLGESLYNRIATFTQHLEKLGSQLGRSVDAYNSAIGSLERTVLPGARKFVDMGIEEKKPMASLSTSDAQPRSREPTEPE